MRYKLTVCCFSDLDEGTFAIEASEIVMTALNQLDSSDVYYIAVDVEG